jgi:hypothetical protein
MKSSFTNSIQLCTENHNLQIQFDYVSKIRLYALELEIAQQDSGIRALAPASF